MTDRELMKQALECTPHKQLIDELLDSRIPKTEREHAAAREIEKLRERLAQPEQEPVAWMRGDGGHVDFYKHPAYLPLYTAPLQRKPLTKEQLLYVYNQLPNWGMDMDNISQDLVAFARAIEKAHNIGEKE